MGLASSVGLTLTSPQWASNVLMSAGSNRKQKGLILQFYNDPIFRKRDDDYFWCQRDNKPWDYCSPPLIFQQKLRCPDDAERMMTADPTDCAR